MIFLIGNWMVVVMMIACYREMDTWWMFEAPTKSPQASFCRFSSSIIGFLGFLVTFVHQMLNTTLISWQQVFHFCNEVFALDLELRPACSIWCIWPWNWQFCQLKTMRVISAHRVPWQCGIWNCLVLVFTKVWNGFWKEIMLHQASKFCSWSNVLKFPTWMGMMNCPHIWLTTVDTFNQTLVYMSSHMIQKGWLNFLVVWINENFLHAWEDVMPTCIIDFSFFFEVILTCLFCFFIVGLRPLFPLNFHLFKKCC